jgi:predicted ester cyclase
MRSTALVVTWLLLAGGLLGLNSAPIIAQEATPSSCPATTEDENIALVRRWYDEVWNQGDLDRIAEILADDYTRSRAGVAFNNAPGTADDVQFVEMVMSEFPDVQFRIDDIFASGDKVAVRTVTTGTHEGALVDLGGAPATGRSMTRENLAIWRVEFGQLAEQWIVQDNFGMLRQLEVITEDELADAAQAGTATSTP